MWFTPCLKLQELMSTIKTTQKCHFYKHVCIFWFYTAKTVTLKYISIFLAVLYIVLNCILLPPLSTRGALINRKCQWYPRQPLLLMTLSISFSLILRTDTQWILTCVEEHTLLCTASVEVQQKGEKWSPTVIW